MKLSTLSRSTAILVLVITGCSSPIHKRDTFDNKSNVETLSIDAKQRVVIIARRRDPDPEVAKALAGAAAAAQSGDFGLLPITCAEPSPDALSALATSVGGSVQDPKVAASFALAQVESAASIGLRTPSIQLLRDGMYRLCEQYAAGGMNGDDWVREQRRYQNLMLSLLAIEQLTGSVVPRQVGLGGGTASASVGDKADEAAGNLAKANSDAATAQSALKKAQDTQTSDEKTCTGDKTSPACAKAADDDTAVKNAQAALDKATESQKTAQQALQAARGAVATDASGAKVNFSDAPKTNQITDASARYIAEATRTIVSTTLLASFAQEECSRVWTFLDKLPSSEMGKFWEGYDTSQKKALSATTDAAILKSGEAKTEDVDTIQSEIVHLARNCQSNEKQLLSESTMFAPQYVATGDLEVLGGQDGITLEPKQSVKFIITGGVRPYQVSGLTPDLAKELTAVVPSPTNGIYYLEIARPEGANKTSGKVIASVADSANAHVDIAVTFAKAAEKAPVTKPTGEAKITGVASKDGQIEVTFTPPATVKVKGYTAKATNKDKESEVLQMNGAPDVKKIDIPKCTDGTTYTVSLEVTPETGSTITVKYAKPIKCSSSASVPPPSSASLRAPMHADAKAQPGGIIVATFEATAVGDGPAVTKYTAAAAPVGGGAAKRGSTPDNKVAPISISGCVAGTSYAVTVVAEAGKVSSKPTLVQSTVECIK